MNKKITIDKIANLAGVSKSTVSKALNNRTDVSEATKRKIKEIVQSYDFHADLSNNSHQNKLSANIGVIFTREERPLSNNPFYSRVLEGIEAELALNGYNLSLKIINKKLDVKLPKFVREQKIKGLILMGIFDDKFIQSLAYQNLPVVQIDFKAQMPQFSQVVIDNEYGGYIATRHLIEHGHKRIGFISGDLKSPSFQQRLVGYKKALISEGIEPDESLIITGGFEQGYQQVKQIMKHAKPSALFVANDLNAILGYSALHDLKLKIPDDISIVGFDNIWQSEITVPPLTTVRVYKEELGSIGVRMLLDAIKGETSKPSTTIIPVRLIERKSVAYYKES